MSLLSNYFQSFLGVPSFLSRPVSIVCILKWFCWTTIQKQWLISIVIFYLLLLLSVSSYFSDHCGFFFHQNQLYSERGGICFYINEGWCTDVTDLHRHCDTNLEFLVLNCKPFYSPREISSFIFVGIYIRPQAKVNEAEQRLALIRSHVSLTEGCQQFCPLVYAPPDT